MLVRPYPQAVAGTPRSFAFDAATKAFTLAYAADPSIAAPTEVFVPVTRYYAVAVEGPATVTSAADAPELTLAAIGAGEVKVTVTKAP